MCLRRLGIYLDDNNQLDFVGSSAYICYQAFLLDRGLLVPYWQTDLPTKKTACQFFQKVDTKLVNFICLEILLHEKEVGHFLLFNKYKKGSFIGLETPECKESSILQVTYSKGEGIIELTSCFGYEKLKPKSMTYFTKEFLRWNGVSPDSWSSCKTLHALAMIHTILHIAKFRHNPHDRVSKWVAKIEEGMRRDSYWFGAGAETTLHAKELSTSAEKHEMVHFSLFLFFVFSFIFLFLIANVLLF